MNKQLVIGLIAFVALFVATSYINADGSTESHSMLTREQVSAYTRFLEWTQVHRRFYREEEQKAYRFLKFKENLEFIHEHNKRYQRGEQTFTVQLNHFADMSNLEFASIYTSKKDVDVTTECHGEVKIIENLPKEVDWGKKQAVNPVRNQGICGSCWAFSAIGSIEGINAITNKKLQIFSTQQLVDCAGGPYENEGCNGGEMDSAMWYVKDNGIALDSKYPYTGKTQKCYYKQNMKAYGISDCAEVPANKTIALASAVAKQPVAIAVEADSMKFQFYSKGVFSGKCGTDLDHGIVLTGYGTLDGLDYWRCKNSWGASWGMSGYILIAKSDEDGPGQCGIMMENAVPIA